MPGMTGVTLHVGRALFKVLKPPHSSFHVVQVMLGCVKEDKNVSGSWGVTARADARWHAGIVDAPGWDAVPPEAGGGAEPPKEQSTAARTGKAKPPNLIPPATSS